MKRFSQVVLRNSMFGFVAQATLKVLSFAFSVLIVRNLGAEIYGQYVAVVAFGAIFAIFSDLGLSPYLVREVARLRDVDDGKPRIQSLYGNVIQLRLLLSLVTTGLVVAAAIITRRPFLMIGAIAFNSIGFFLYSFQGTSDAVLSGMERLDLSAGGKILNQMIFVGLGGVALLFHLGIYGLVASGLVGAASLAVYSWRCLTRAGIYPSWLRSFQWGQLLRASLPFGLIGFALGLSYKFDTVLLNVFRSNAETAYYNAAYNLVFSAVLVSNILNTALYPSLSRHAAVDAKMLPRIYGRALRYLMMASIPIAVGGWALAAPIVRFLYTDSFLPAVSALQVIIWVVPLMFASEFLGYVVVISDQERHAARAVLMSTGANIVVNLFLVPRFGFQAAAWMTVITEAILVGQYVWLTRALIRAGLWKTILLRPFLAAGLMGGLLFVLRGQVSLVLCILAGGALYVSLLFIFGAVSKTEVLFLLDRQPIPEIQLDRNTDAP
jgi:O-antigen/teichoic acid export membrane protein